MKYWGPINSAGGVAGTDSYVDGDPGAGTEGSIPTFRGFQQMLWELHNLVELTGLTPSSDLTKLLSKQISQAIQSGKLSYAADTGSANAMVVTLPVAPPAYAAGLRLWVKVIANNTGATTVNVNGLGTKSVKRVNGQAVLAGDLLAAGIAEIVYDGTNFQLVSFNGSTLPRTTLQIFTASATFTATVAGPHKFTAWGAGGGGGYGAAGAPGSGGSAGAYGEKTLVLAVGDTVPIVIGAGGAAGASGVGGLAGGNTTITYNAVTYTAGGGPGGLNNASSGTSTNSPGLASTTGAWDRTLIAGRGGFGFVCSSPGATGGSGGGAPNGGIGGIGGGGASTAGSSPGGGAGGAANAQLSAAGARGEVWVES